MIIYYKEITYNNFIIKNSHIIIYYKEITYNNFIIKKSHIIILL